MDTVDKKPTGYLEISDLWVKDNKTRAKLMDIMSTWVATGLSYPDFLKAYKEINPNGFDISGIVYHSLPDKEHNGWLDETQRVRVSHREYFHDVLIEGTYGDIYLEASEALELLVWLRQNEAKLVELAKEQA